jgi:hypothetical protein
MSPLQEQVDRLHKVVEGLESRLAGLEAAANSDKPPTSMRMVLMGPPGAGESFGTSESRR